MGAEPHHGPWEQANETWRGNGAKIPCWDCIFRYLFNVIDLHLGRAKYVFVISLGKGMYDGMVKNYHGPTSSAF